MSRTRDLHSNVDERRKVPRWLPITLLTMATVALTVPAALLWRQKQTLVQTAIGRKHATSVPPARRRPLTLPSSVQSTSSNPSAVSQTGSHPSVLPPPRRTSIRSNVLRSEFLANANEEPVISSSGQSRGTKLSDSLFDGPFMSLGALGVATGAVGVGAALGIWGVQNVLGVNNVEEFAARVRQMLLTYMPAISRRIYRSSSDEVAITPSSVADSHEGGENEGWTWEAAENRLRDAFDRGGVGQWAECAVQELEAEEKIERKRRGL